MVKLLYFPLYVLYAGLFIKLIFKWSFFDIAGVNKRHLVCFFLLKVVAGLGLTLVYTYYYTDQSKADIYRYFADSKIISSVLFTNPVAWFKIMTGAGTFEPGTFKYLTDTWHFTHPAGDFITTNAFLIRVVSLLNYLSCYNIYIDTLLFNCINFTGLVLLFKTLKPYFSSFPQILYWPLFLMPSFVFWGSGLLKEGLMFVGIALFMRAWLNDNNRWIVKWVGFIIGFLIVWQTKIYVAVVLMLCYIFQPVKVNNRLIKMAWAGTLFLCVAIGLIASYHYRGYVCDTIVDKHNEFIRLSLEQRSGTNLDTTLVIDDCRHLVGLIPTAMINAVLRPFIWTRGNLFEMLFGLENLLFILSLILLPLLFFKKPVGQKLWLALFCLLFAVLNYLGIGITVPIMGAIVHYRIVAAPFLLLTVLLMIDLEKLKQRLRRLFSF